MIQLTMECCLVMQLADDANSECCTLVATRRRLQSWTPIHWFLVLQWQMRHMCNLQCDFTMRILSAAHFGQLNKPFYTPTLLHTNPFTHRRFYTQTLLHTKAFTVFYTQTPFSHKIAFTHTRAKGLRADLQNRNFTSVFDTRPSFRAKGLRANLRNRNFTTRLDIKTYESEQSAANAMSSYKKYHFTAVLAHRSSFCAKGLPPREKSQFHCSFGRSKLVSCERLPLRL